MSNTGRGPLPELATAFAVVMVLAVLGYASYSRSLATSKVSEAQLVLNQLFKAASAYYDTSHHFEGMPSTHCTIGSVVDRSVLCSSSGGCGSTTQHAFPSIPEYLAIGLSPLRDTVYNAYHVDSIGPGCARTANTDVYTFRANGDLDCDGVLSSFAMSVASDSTNQLYHNVGLQVRDEAE